MCASLNILIFLAIFLTKFGTWEQLRGPLPNTKFRSYRFRIMGLIPPNRLKFGIVITMPLPWECLGIVKGHIMQNSAVIIMYTNLGLSPTRSSEFGIFGNTCPARSEWILWHGQKGVQGPLIHAKFNYYKYTNVGLLSKNS